jgi:hypothetical protein
VHTKRVVIVYLAPKANNKIRIISKYLQGTISAISHNAIYFQKPSRGDLNTLQSGIASDLRSGQDPSTTFIDSYFIIRNRKNEKTKRRMEHGTRECNIVK